jgi:hypothetical protein
MEISNKSSGEPLNDLTLFAVDTPASHSAQLANDEEPTTQDTFGHGSETALAHYDPDMRSWKMSEDISLWGELPSLESLPKSGMTRNGVLYQQPDWVRPIDVNGSSLLHTPTATMNQMSPSMVARSGWWPTPQARDWKGPSGRSLKGTECDLPMAVQMWPTPTTVDTFTPKSRKNPTLGDAARKSEGNSGKLNPMWVEWLMGFPVGWTDLED